MTHNNGNQRVGDHAIVLGASLAGLATAATLAGRFDRVTIIERDTLPAIGQQRRGVPQGRHAHLLLPAGFQALTTVVPGFEADLRARGGHVIPSDEFRFYLNGVRLALQTDELAICGATRPLLEGVVREQVRSVPNVEFREGTEVIELVATRDGSQVTGVRVRNGQASEVLDAALVADMTGRGSRTPHWLAELGYPEVGEDRMDVAVRYTTRLFRRNTADLDGCRHVVIAAKPGERRAGLILAVEDGRWLVTMVGLNGQRPPTDLPGFVDYAGSLPQNELHEVVSRAMPIGDAATGTFGSYLRQRYDRMAKLPAGFVVSGDAVCSFNPVYAQGMSVAFVAAQVLGEVLDQHGMDRVGRRLLRRTKALVDGAWALATGGDLVDPAVDGPRPLSWRLINGYLDRLVPIAHHDPVVAEAVFRVNALLDPPQRLMRPSIAARVLTRLRGHAELATTDDDPAPVH